MTTSQLASTAYAISTRAGMETEPPRPAATGQHDKNEQTSPVRSAAVVDSPSRAKSEEQNGSAKATYEPQPLLRICERYISQHMDILTSRRIKGMVLPVDCFLRILRYVPKGTLAPERMLKVVLNLPSLDCPEVDEAYWRQVVTNDTNTPISAPYSVLVQRMKEHKQALDEWLQLRSSKPQAANRESVLQVLTELKRVPFSEQLLRDSMLGFPVNQLVKLQPPDTNIITAAKALRTAWKALVFNPTTTSSSSSASSTPSPSRAKGAVAADGKSDSGEDDDPMSTAAIGQRALQMTTWKQVYMFTQDYERHRRLKVGKRALEMREELEGKRHRTKDLSEAPKPKQRREPKHNVDKVRKLLGIRAAVGRPQKKDTIGIVFKDRNGKRIG